MLPKLRLGSWGGLLLLLACGGPREKGETAETAETGATAVGATAATTSTTGTGNGSGSSAEASSDDGGDGVRFDAADGESAGTDESTCEAVEKSLSSAGCHFVPVVAIANGARPWAVVAANTNVQDANVTLYDRAGAEIRSATIAPGALEVFLLEGGSPELAAHQTDGRVTGLGLQGMRLESDVPIVASQFSPYSTSRSAFSDSSLLLPVHVWDTEHTAVMYANDGYIWALVVSAENDNEITVTAPATFDGRTEAGIIPSLSAGQSASLTLQAGQTLRVAMAQGNGDMTGLRFVSSKPTQFFVGSPSMSVPGPGMNFAKDYMEEVIPPESTWGTRYAVVRFMERGGESEIYRFVAAEDDTEITLSGDYSETVTLSRGEFHQVITPESFYAQGDKPFLVSHIAMSYDQNTVPKDEARYPGEGQSGNCGASTNPLGDPAISYVVPTDQFRQNYTFLTPETFAWDNITVTAPMESWADIELDGAPLPESPTDLGVGGFGYAHIRVEDGTHNLTAPVPVGLDVHGYDCAIIYASPGGLNLARINVGHGGE